MNEPIGDLVAMIKRTSNLAEATLMLYKQQMESTEALIIQLLLSNGGSLPITYSLYEEATSGAWELHEGDGRMWVEKKGEK